MKKTTDLILLVLLVAGFVFGVYTVGNLVTDESNEAGKLSAGTTQTTTTPSGAVVTTTASATDDDDDRRELQILVAEIAAAAIGAIILIAAFNAFIRRGRRQRWQL
jgi:hypothetical protein